MSCRSWRSDELLPVAYSLSEVMMRDDRIGGVAITGSVARLEAHVHDIDLIIFHDGRMRDGSVNIRSCAYHGNGDQLEFLLDCLGKGVYGEIFGILSKNLWDDIPANLIFVHKKILGECDYLQSFLPHLKRGLFSKMRGLPRGGRGKIDEFYSTVFCDVPLLIIDSDQSRGFRWDELCNLGERLPGFSRLRNISHQCGDVRCKPMKSWVRQRWEVKKERGYACVEELQRAAQNGLSLSAAGDGALSLAQEGGELSLVKK